MSKHLLAVLKNLRVDVHAETAVMTSGICHNVETNLYYHYEDQMLLQDLMKAWPKYSGYWKFPIPDPMKPDNQDEAMWIYYKTHSMWDKTTAYGRLRWELLEWMIEQLEKRHE